MRSFAAAALALLLAACGGSNASHPAVTEEDRALGAEQHPQLLAEFGGSYDAPEAGYLRAVGERIAAPAGLKGLCTFTLVNSDVVNAFAVPGCYIYVTRGLMGIVNSEAELASVLGHEIGHIVAAHSKRQQERTLWRGIGVAAIAILTGSDRLTRFAGTAAQYFGLRYSRGQEYEADDLGIRYVKDAGYDPYAATDMLGALGRQEQYLARTSGRDEARSIPEWARTHPLTTQRIERAQAQARKTGVGPSDLPENEAGYLNEVDGLLYGDDPEQGFVFGRRFAHPVMRIGFEAPKGFTLTNSPQAILIQGPGDMRGEFAGGQLPSGGLEDYAERVLASALSGQPSGFGTAQQTLINGIPALIVPVRVQGPRGTVEVTLAAFAGDRTSAYHFLMVSPAGEQTTTALSALFGSFRLLDDREVASLRPRVIRVVTANAGDTPQRLASRMASDNRLDLWLMLNDRRPEQALTPGDRVKIIDFSD